MTKTIHQTNKPNTDAGASIKETGAMSGSRTDVPAPTLEIAPKLWAEFFASLKAPQHRVHILARGKEGAPRDVANNVPLHAIRLEHEHDGCSSMLVVETGEDQAKPNRHQIVEPFQIWLENRDGDRFGRLQIKAESGSMSIDFHPLLTYERTR